MGGLVDVEDPPPAARPVWFVTEGEAPSMHRPAELVLEDGTSLRTGSELPPDIPIGYHDLNPDDGGPTTRLIVTPRACHLDPRLRTWAWAAQLYSVRSARSWGFGDLGDLRALARWSEGLGAGLLAVNPLHAPLPLADQEPSPYYPSSRRYLNPLYIDVEAVPGFDPATPVLASAASAGRALNAARRIVRGRVHELKLLALEHLWSTFGDHEGEFASYCRHGGDALFQYGAFCALAEHHGGGYRSWPAEHRRPVSLGVERFVASHRERVDFHMWLQWLLDVQLSAAGEDLPLLGDLAVGVDPQGADAWVWQDVLARDVHVGAPPDDFNEEGQDWGLPPFVPWRLRAVGYEPWIQTLRASMRHCGALRVDHVMGLFRLFWIPEGASPAEGAYVRYPASEMLDVVAIESSRSGTTIIGEDLGTVEDDVRDRLRDRSVLSYRLVWFERDLPKDFPVESLAAVSTHDLPTIAGVWSGQDGSPEMRERLIAVSGAAQDSTVEEAVVRTHQALSGAPSRIRVATLEDGLRVTARPNVPGTSRERPNWSLALPVPMEQMMADGTVLAVASALNRGTSPSE